MTASKLLFAFLVICSHFAAQALDHYRVNFNSPLHTAGEVPTTGIGSAGPSGIVFGTPTVVSSFGHLTDQPLVFEAVDYEQIYFELGLGLPNYFIEFDFETRNLNPSLFAFTVLFDTPVVNNVYLHGLGEIHVPGLLPQPGWADDALHHMRIEADLETRIMRVLLDDRAPIVTTFFPSGGDVFSIRLNLSEWRFNSPDDPSVQVAIDNLVIGSIVPEARIVSPSPGATILTGSILPLIAEATSPKAPVQSVEFLANGTSIGLGANIPGTINYRFDWVPTTPGEYAIRAVGRDAAGNVFSSPQVNVTAAPLIVVSRSLPETYRPGHKAMVRLSAVPIVPVALNVIVDRLPAGWTAEHISDGGVFDPVNGVVRFGPFPDNASPVLKYQARAPANASGLQRFEGTAFANGFPHAITGHDTIAPAGH